MVEDEGGVYARVKRQGREIHHPCRPLLRLRMSGAMPTPHMLSFPVQGKLRSLSYCDPDCSVVPRMRTVCSRRWHIAWGGMRFTSLCKYLHILAALLLFHLLNVFPPMSQQLPVGQGLLIIEVSRLFSAHYISQDSSGRAISPPQRPLPDNTQHSQDTDTHASGRIRTRNPSKRTATDPRLRLRGHWDRP